MKAVIEESILRIYALIVKEFLTILKDKSSRVILFAPIIVQCFIFGYGASYHLEHVPYALYCQDNSKEAFSLLMRIKHTPKFEQTAVCNDMHCLTDKIDSQEALLGIYIPENFYKTKNIDILTDARNTASANTAASYVTQIIDENNSKNSILNFRYLFNPNNYTRYTILIGMCLGLSVIQVLLLSALSVCREKEDGTYDMMLMTPSKTYELLLGKAIAPVAIATVQSIILILICNFYFAIEIKGDVFSLLCLIVLFDLAIVGLGLAISTLCKTTMQALISGFSCCLVLILTSGLLTSIDGMPDWFRIIAKMNPVHYGIYAIWNIYLEGKSIFDILDLLIPLAVLGVITFSIAAYLFRHRIDN